MANERAAGGVRPPDYLYEMAIGRIEDLMVQATPWKLILAKLSDDGYTESEDTAKNWRREVMRRWAVEDAETRPARKDQWRARLEMLYGEILGKARDAAGSAQAILYAEAIKVAKVAIVMDGVQSPIAVHHSGTIDVAAMSPGEREKEIAELLARREKALAAAKVVH